MSVTASLASGGTRIWVSLFVDNLADGATEAEIQEAYPALTRDDIRAALAYAAEMARERYVDIPNQASDMRFKLDENIDARLTALLHEAGHDATTVREQGLHGTEDPDLFNYCVSEARSLVTLDLDFSNVLRYPPERTPGVIVSSRSGRSFSHCKDSHADIGPSSDL